MKSKHLLLTLLMALVVPWAAQAQQALPYSYGFENNNLAEEGWTAQVTSTSSGINSQAAHEGSYGFRFNYSEQNAYLVSPLLTGTDNGVALSFYYGEYSSDYGDEQFYVGYTTDETVTDPSAFTYGDITTASTSWQLYEAPLPAGTKRVAIKYVYNDAYYLYLDDFTFGAPASCIKPTGLAVTLTPGDGTKATFSWTENGTATQWQLCLNGDETNLIEMTENPFTYTGLTAETTYTAKVRAYCGATDQSAWSNEVTFTPTNVYSITVNDGTSTNAYVPFYGYYADSDANSQFIIPATDLGAMQWGTINAITFYGSGASATWTGAVFDIYFSEVNNTVFESAALVDWSELDSKVYTGSVSVVDNKMELTLTAPYQYMGGNLLIGFDETSNSSNYPSMSWYGVTQTTNTAVYKYSSNAAVLAQFLPKVTFSYTPGEEPDCMKPSGLAVNYTGGLTAEVSWTSNAEAWQICLNDDEDNLIDASTNPYTLTGLELATTYNVKVRAFCNDRIYSDWTNPVSFTTDMCMPENQCELTFELTDSYGDGWNGAYIDVVDVLTGASLGQMANEDLNGTSDSGENELNTLTLAVCDGREIQFVWHTGQYDNEASYVVTDINGEEIFSGSGAMSAPVNYTVSCTVTNCKKPTNVAASQVGPRSAVLSWTENGEATAWIVAYKEATATDFTEVNASTNPFTLEGLTPETAYTVKVKPECDLEKWSDEIGFTTTEACPAPTGFAASNITAHTADLAWTGFSESYTVQYRTAAYMDGIEEGFGTSSLPTGWTRYTGLVDNVMAGTATLASTTSGWSFDTNNGVFDNHARSNIYGASWNKWLVTPSIEVSGHLSFDLALTAYSGTVAAPATTGTDDRFVVLISTDEKATWTILREWNNSGSSYVYNDITCSATGENVTIDLSSYMGQTVYIAFYGESTASNADNNLHIDNVTCGTPVPAGAWQNATAEGTTANLSGLLAETKYEATVQGDCGTDGTSAVASTTFTTDIACPAPTGLAYNSLTVKSTSVDLSWTNGGAEDWVLAYKKTADEDFTEVALASADVTVEEGLVSYTLANLDPETEYTVKVRDNCEASVAGDGVSTWTAAVTFTTLANCPVPTNLTVSNIGHYTADLAWTGDSEGYNVDYRTAAYVDGIEEGFGTDPTGWIKRTGVLNTDGTATLTGTSSWSTGTSNNVFDRHAYMNLYSTKNYWYITPSMAINNGDALSFDLAYTAYSGSNVAPNTGCTTHRFAVLISTDEMATWTILREWNNSGSAYVLDEVSPNGQNSGNIDLSAYAGETAYIAFFGHSETNSYDNNFHFDNVTIGTPVAAGEWQHATSDVASTTLSGLTVGTDYEVRAQAVCNRDDEWSDIVSFTTLAENVKVFVTDGDWNEAGNWMDGLTPTLNDNAQLQANATITGLATAGNVTIASGKTLTIADGGQLQHNNSSTITATVKKNITGYGADNANTNNGYVLLASPFGKSIYQNNSDGTGLRNGTYDLYSWARTTALEWTNYGSSNSSSLYMSRGTGYLYANQEDTEITFAGSIYGSGSSYSAYVSYTAPTAGTTDFSDWNLLGNPFVCNAYLVDAATNGNALAFYKMNADGNGFEATTGTAIAPMEGVFYQATEAGNVYFTREMSATSTQPGTLNISLAQVVATRGAKGSTDNAIIRFGEGNTLGKFSFNENSAKVYIPQNGKDYAVVNAGNVGEMPVNFKANENGSYTLSFSNSEVTFSYLHLIDNMTGADVDLLATPSYTFDARYTDYASRFRLVFATGSSANGENFGFVNASGNLSIFGIEGTATLQVIDVTGRILSSETFSGSYERKLNAAPGVYMLRLINGNDVKVQKIVVR